MAKLDLAIILLCIFFLEIILKWGEEKILIVTLFIIVQNLKQPKHLSRGLVKITMVNLQLTSRNIILLLK